MQTDHAETANIEKLISRIGAGLDQEEAIELETRLFDAYSNFSNTSGGKAPGAS